MLKVIFKSAGCLNILESSPESQEIVLQQVSHYPDFQERLTFGKKTIGGSTPPFLKSFDSDAPRE